MPFLRPPDRESVVYEFFHPFAHLPGRIEWCRILSPTHGGFDTAILLGGLTSEPATVYVATPNGERFMADRYPERETFRVASRDLGLSSAEDGRVVVGRLRTKVGPLREAEMTFKAPASAKPRNESYGGDGRPVWGSKRFTCWGVDLALDARVEGRVLLADGREERFDGVHGIVTLGSFGRISPLENPPV